MTNAQDDNDECLSPPDAVSSMLGIRACDCGDSVVLYELSVYLLNGFRGLFLGGFGGAILAVVACSFVSAHPTGGRAPDGRIAFDWLSWGLATGAVLGLGTAVCISYHHLRDEREEQKIEKNEVWPPTPDRLSIITLSSPQPNYRKKLSLVLALAGCAIGLVALTMEGQLLWGFWQDTQTLPPGTPIRPMGLTLIMGVVATAAVLLGCPLSGIGLFFGIKSRSRKGIAIGIIGLCLCLAPLPMASELFRYLAAERGLFLEP